MIRPVGNIGVDDKFYLYARKVEGGKFVDITGMGNIMTSAKLTRQLNMNRILRYNLTKSDRTQFYHKAGNFPDNLDRS